MCVWGGGSLLYREEDKVLSEECKLHGVNVNTFNQNGILLEKAPVIKSGDVNSQAVYHVVEA